MSAAIASVWAKTAQGAPLANGRELQLFLSRVLLLGAYRLPSRARAQKASELDSLPVARTLVDAAHEVERDPPTGFDRLLEDLGAGTPPDLHRLGARFGAFYRALYAQWRGDSVDDLRLALDAYVARTWTGQLARRNRRLSVETIANHEWIPAGSAARLLHWRAPRLRRAVECGMLEGHLNGRPSGRITGVVHRRSLEALRVEMASWLDLKTACTEMRVGKKKLHALMADGKLRAVDGPTVSGVASWKFRRTDLVEAIGDKPARTRAEPAKEAPMA